MKGASRQPIVRVVIPRQTFASFVAFVAFVLKCFIFSARPQAPGASIVARALARDPRQSAGSWPPQGSL